MNTDKESETSYHLTAGCGGLDGGALLESVKGLDPVLRQKLALKLYWMRFGCIGSQAAG